MHRYLLGLGLLMALPSLATPLSSADFSSNVTVLEANASYSLNSTIFLTGRTIDGQGSTIDCNFFNAGPAFYFSGSSPALVFNLSFKNCHNRAILSTGRLEVHWVR